MAEPLASTVWEITFSTSVRRDHITGPVGVQRYRISWWVIPTRRKAVGELEEFTLYKGRQVVDAGFCILRLSPSVVYQWKLFLLA